MHFRRNCPAL